MQDEVVCIGNIREYNRLVREEAKSIMLYRVVDTIPDINEFTMEDVNSAELEVDRALVDAKIELKALKFPTAGFILAVIDHIDNKSIPIKEQLVMWEKRNQETMRRLNNLKTLLNERRNTLT